MESEASGWIIPIDSREEPSVFFSSQLGNGIIGIRPRSDLPLLAPIRLSLDSTGTIAMKIIDQQSMETHEQPIAEWAADSRTINRMVEAELRSNRKEPMVDFSSFTIDVRLDDIELDNLSFRTIAERFTSGSVTKVGSR